MPDFVEQRIPDKFAFRSRGGSVFETRVAKNPARYEQRNQQFSAPLRVYELMCNAKLTADYEELREFIETVAAGRLRGFRLRDPFDYVCLAADGRLGLTAVGTGIPTYQIYKRYGSGSYTYDKKILKLVLGTLTVYRNASPVTAGVSAGNYAVDVDTGIVTFVADATASISTHTPGASHVFTTASDIAALVVGKKVYISGATVTGGTDVLNGVAHTISNKSGTGPYTWTISTTTTGRTVSNGTISAFPQASDALTAAFEFDIPVRLDDDKMLSDILAPGVFSPDRLTALELRM